MVDRVYHGVEGADEFAHDGDKDDLGRFAGFGEALPEGFHDRIVLSGAKGCHVGGIAQEFAAADGASLPHECSAFAVERSHAEQ